MKCAGNKADIIHNLLTNIYACVYVCVTLQIIYGIINILLFMLPQTDIIWAKSYWYKIFLKNIDIRFAGIFICYKLWSKFCQFLCWKRIYLQYISNLISMDVGATFPGWQREKIIRDILYRQAFRSLKNVQYY